MCVSFSFSLSSSPCHSLSSAQVEASHNIGHIKLGNTACKERERAVSTAAGVFRVAAAGTSAATRTGDAHVRKNKTQGTKVVEAIVQKQTLAAQCEQKMVVEPGLCARWASQFKADAEFRAIHGQQLMVTAHCWRQFRCQSKHMAFGLGEWGHKFPCH